MGPRIGVALGAGAARGWAHVGVLEALDELGVRPHVVAGCSSGAMVGAFYAADRLESLRAFAERLTWTRMLGYFDLSWRGGGLIEGRWLTDFMRAELGDLAIEALDRRFGAVATDLNSGRETWLVEGDVADAVRASIALPGLMTPARRRGRWLVDGAIVNPLPVSLCRALGADIIIGVTMQGDLLAGAERAARRDLTPAAPEPVDALDDPRVAGVDPPLEPLTWTEWLTSGYWPKRSTAAGADQETRQDLAAGPTPPPEAPTAPPLAPPAAALQHRLGYYDVLNNCFSVLQNFVARVRLAADPVELLIAPDVADINFMDFHKARHAIAAGRAAVEARREEILAACAGERAAAGPSLPPAAAPLPTPTTN